MSPSDISLLARWANDGDAEAFKEIASRHAAMVYATCKRILRNDADAEDVAQECFLTLAKTTKRPKTHLAAWLQAVATNRALDRIRAEKRRKERETRFVSEQPAPAETQWNDLSVHIDEAVAELPENLRQPIVLHFFENQTHDAIARQMGVSRTAITHRIQKGIERIRKSLRRRGAIVTAAALGALLQKHLVAEAAPRSLLVALSKIALAGTARASAAGVPGTLAMFGGLLFMKKIAIGAAVVIALGLVLWKAVPPRPTGPETTTTSLGKRQPSSDASEHVRTPPVEHAPTVKPQEHAQPEEERAVEATLGTVAGKVYDAETGRPLADVMLFLASRAEPGVRPSRTTTDKDGQYRFDEVAAGVYDIDYAGLGLPARGQNEAKTVSLDDGQFATDVDFAVVMGHRIRGRLVDTEGRQVTGAMVMAAPNPYVSDETMVNDLAADDGAFELCFGFRQTAQFLFACTVPVFGAQGDMLASDVHGPVSPSTDGSPEIELVMYPTARISGVVVDARGLAVADVLVVPGAERQSGFIQAWEAGRTDSDGAFSLVGLPAGSYRLGLLSPEGGQSTSPRPPYGSIELAHGQVVEGLKLVLDRGLAVSGRVSDEMGNPVVGAYIRCAEGQARSKEDGAYTLTGLTAGQYTLKVDHEQYVDVSREHVSAGQSGIDFRMKRRGAIEGRVIDAVTGRPIAEFQVLHFPEIFTPFAPGWERNLVSQVDENGAFHIPDVRPGRVTVVARARGYLQASVEVPYVAPAETVSDVVLRLEKGLTVEGEVLTSAGQPVANAAIIPGRLQGMARAEESIAARSDADGKFTLIGLAPDLAVISAHHPQYPAASTPVTLIPGRVNNVTIVFDEGGTVEGVVYFDGEPWPDRAVKLHTLPPSGISSSATTSETGHYRVSAVQAGEVGVTVEVEGLDLRNPSGRRTLSQTAIVSNGKTTVLDFNYIPGSASVEGRITSNGEAIRGGSLSLFLSTTNGDEKLTRLIKAEDNGYYRFDELPAAFARLSVSDNSSTEFRHVEFDIQEGQAVRQDIEFSTGAAVSGSVSGLKSDERLLVFVFRGEVSVNAENAEETIRQCRDRIANRTFLNEDGHYNVGGLTPDRYTVVALVHTFGPDPHAPDVTAVSTTFVEITDESVRQLDLMF